MKWLVVQEDGEGEGGHGKGNRGEGLYYDRRRRPEEEAGSSYRDGKGIDVSRDGKISYGSGMVWKNCIMAGVFGLPERSCYVGTIQKNYISSKM